MNYAITLLEKNGKETELTDFNIHRFSDKVFETFQALKSQTVPPGHKIEAYLPTGQVMIKKTVAGGFSWDNW